MAELQKILHIQQTNTLVFHPASNGIVERFNRILVDYLSKTEVTGKKNALSSWHLHLPMFIMVYNATPHRAHGMSPHMAHYGWEPKEIKSSIIELVESPLQEAEVTLENIPQLVEASIFRAREALARYHQSMDHYENSDHKGKSCYQVGDKVWYHKVQRNKLTRPYTGPWEIHSLNLPTVVLKKIHPISKKEIMEVAHVNNIGPSKMDSKGTEFWDASIEA
ncbi:MAG: transposase family protein, partial [Desulfobacterales bacterium]|nr:transposase family protein [Desulfobacterales bacterium]